MPEEWQASWHEQGEPPEVYKDPVSMDKDTPTTADPKQLQRDLRRLGLGCEQTEEPALREFIAQVREELPSGGAVHAAGVGTRDYQLLSGSEPASRFVEDVLGLAAGQDSELAGAIVAHEGAGEFFDRVLRDNPGGQQAVNAMAGSSWGSPGFVEDFANNDPQGVVFLARLARADVKITAATTWKWTRDDETGRVTRSDLAELSYPARWARLNGKEPKTQRSSCRKGQQPGKRWANTGFRHHVYNDALADAGAIKKHYKTMGGNLTSALDEGLDKQCIEGAIANQLAFLKDESFANEDFDSRTKDSGGNDLDQEFLVFLVYQPTRDDVQGVGVVAVQWRLTVEKFRQKKQKTHPTSMEFWIRTLLYPSVYDPNDPKGLRTMLSDQTTEDLRLTK
ncbi:hypothetical protein [Streptomyces griseus]|uniref:hypothetical protein n=1 Tax=Streptomyces griseus TaxID=1911 RepID=UPI00364DD376